MRQLDAELRRFFARRMVKGTFLIAIFIVVLAVTIGTAKGHRGSQAFVDSNGQVHRQDATYPDGTTEQPGFFVGQSDTRTNIAKDLEHVFEGTGVALLFAAFALGASFVGAEFNVGSLTTQLLFEPRRSRVHAAKAVAVAVGSAALAVAVLLFLAMALYVGSELRGVVNGLDGAFVFHRALQASRIAAAVGAAGAMTYCVTLVAKRSSAGMIAFYLQYPLLFLLDPKKMPFGLISHYLPLRGLLAVLIDPVGVTGTNERTIHTIAGGVVLTLVWIVILAGGSGFAFSRAEVR
jgi:hypothetical protein